MNDLLLLVDLQPAFLVPALDPVVAACVERCQAYQAQGKHIVTTNQHGYTHALDYRLMAQLDGYSNHLAVTKYADEGSTEAARAIQRLGVPLRSILVGGVNACCCVLGTASGLVGIGYQVELDDALIGCGAEHALDGHRDRAGCLKYLRDNVRTEPYPYVQLLRSQGRQLI